MSIESKVTGLASKVRRRLSGRWRRDPPPWRKLTIWCQEAGAAESAETS